MNEDEVRRAVLAALAGVAPEADVCAVAPDADLRRELDLDSMDFLRFVVALHETFRVDVPESDYRRVATLRGCVEYVARRLARAGS